MTFTNKQPLQKTKAPSLTFFMQKVCMFLRPAKTGELKLASKSSIELDSVVVIDMTGEQPLVEAFRNVKLMNFNGKKKINILVNRVHSEVQAKAIYNKLSGLCRNFLDVELVYLGGVPSDGLLQNDYSENQKISDVSETSFGAKCESRLDFLQNYWSQTHPVAILLKENSK